MKLGYIGLGKMGYNMALRLCEKGHTVVVHNRSPQKTEKFIEETGSVGALTLKDVVKNLEMPRTIWIMVPNNAVEDIVNELGELLSPEDTIIDGGNTYYKDSIERAKRIRGKGINYLDVGVSGGPQGARNGTSLMIGGSREVFKDLESLFEDLSVQDGYAYMGESGSGHFVKMVHNGIEYGMMQAIAEGFDVLKNSEFDLDFNEVIKPYKNGSVIESELINWLDRAFKRYGTDLEEISDKASHSGEGEWTVDTARELGVNVKVIEDALQARINSQDHPNFQAQIISAMRGEFGGHPVLKEN